TNIATAPRKAALALDTQRRFFRANRTELVEAAAAIAVEDTVDASPPGTVMTHAVARAATNVEEVAVRPRRASPLRSFSSERSTRIRAAFSPRPRTRPTSL